MKRYGQLTIVVFACIALLGCMTMQALGTDRAQLSTLKAGDRVEVVTTGGQRLSFKIEKVDESGVRGEGQDVAFSNIQSISREKIAVGRTVLIVLGIAAVAAAAAGGGGGGGGY